jgi:hypothetical protein
MPPTRPKFSFGLPPPMPPEKVPDSSSTCAGVAVGFAIGALDVAGLDFAELLDPAVDVRVDAAALAGPN